jgi:general stress protein YciG
MADDTKNKKQSSSQNSSDDNRGWHGDQQGHSDAGKQAAQTAKARYGDDFHQKIGEEGGEATASSHDRSFYEKIGEEGGNKRKDQGTDYQELGRMGGEKRAEMADKGQAPSMEETGRAGGTAPHSSRGRQSDDDNE